MKTLLRATIILLSSTVLMYCSGNKHEHREITPELEEANGIHQKSLDIREQIMDLEKSLKEAEIDYSEAKEMLKLWDKDIIEVPGFEHSHDHGHEGEEQHRKFHVHNPMKPFSDAEHLEYQKVMHDEIVQIQETLKVLLAPKIMDEENQD